MQSAWDRKRERNGKAYAREYARKRYREKNPDARQNNPISRGAVNQSERVPAEVLADRDRRRDYVQTIGERAFGDPPHGQSALDQMRKR